MRGLAVLIAMGGVWLAMGGESPRVRVPMPSFTFRTAAAALGAGLAGAAVAFGLLGTVVPALALGVLAMGIPIQVSGGRERRRRMDAASLWPDLLAHIRSSVAAGHTLPDAYLDAGERVAGPFAEDLDDLRRELVFGGGFRPAMETVRRRFDDPIADRVTTTLTIANETGGMRVGEVLAALSASIAGEMRLRAAHDASLTEQRWTAGVALSAPWIILALSIATNPQASRAFSTTEGAVVVAVGLAMTATGYVLSRRLAALSDPPRMFRQ